MRFVRPLVRPGVAVVLALSAGVAVLPLGGPAAGASPHHPTRSSSGTKVFPPTITALVSVTPSGGSGNDYSDASSLSSDGRYIAWEDSSTNLVPDDTNNTW